MQENRANLTFADAEVLKISALARPRGKGRQRKLFQEGSTDFILWNNGRHRFWWEWRTVTQAENVQAAAAVSEWGEEMSTIPVVSKLTFRHMLKAAIFAVVAVKSLFLAGALSAATAQADELTEAIVARIEAYRSAWNTHDEEAVAAFYTEDAVFVIGNLPATQGRPTIAKWWRKYFDRQEAERRISIAINSIRTVTADTAVANITTTTGGQDADGGELLSRKARGTWLLHRQDDGWFIAALFAMPTEEDQVILNPSLQAAKALTPRIRALVEDFEDAFNSHDAAVVGSFFADDADIIVRNGSLTQGRQAIEEAWRTYFSEPVPFRAIMIVNDIRMITPDVAQLNLTVAALTDAEDGVLPVRHTHVGWVVVRQPDGWRISALRVLPSEDDQIIRASDRQAN